MFASKFSTTPLALVCLFCMLFHASESAQIYITHYCKNETLYQPNTPFQSNLTTLLSSLVSNSNNGFYRTSVGQYTSDDIDGLFLCRGDVNATVCHGCVAAAATNITRLCPNDTESYIWYDVCMLSYSNSTFDNDNIVPAFSIKDEESTINSNRDQFNQLLAKLLHNLTEKAAGREKFAAGEVSVSSTQTLYGMAQCVPDVETATCNACFQSAISNLPTCCDGSEGAKFLLPVCTIRYQLYPFLYNTSITTLLPPPSSEARLPLAGRKHALLVGAIIIPIAILAALLVMGCCWWRRRSNKNREAVLEMNDSIRKYLTSEEESLHFDLATIEAATDRFSNEMKIGEGGFGMVYKGIFPNGQEIAVKRLSRASLQGDTEFRNEASLVAQLQHRNLVRLLGFCLEGTERILVYEYIPNSSLDHFLFGHEDHGELDWARRYNIIVGIARGLQYLHLDSRLTVIHRDLKTSNILLDDNMNPKISDFGLAKIFHGDQSQENTRTGRVVGTYGYMSPEYAMHGKFSVKSDVFSFGVLVLEILSGKKNNYESHQADDLLSFAWMNWTNQTPFLILDPKLRGSYSRIEVRRCVHIALLCVQENPADRPSMANIMLALNSYSVTLALPRQPASLPRGRATPDRLKHQLDTSIPFSSTDSLITEVYPR
ncbi:hypothetical protein Fmac_023395 [Flemingia macrophylla]|uniref:Cysteine-rich receptor-like protein kinase 10 n=1 Tax=Flemingia macrophylla TaxID=520843 RepID=A0ABD1LLE1_9FABA